MIFVLVLLVVAAGFVAWDRSSARSAAPDTRLITIGVVVTAVGLLSSVLFWWLIVPVLILFAGATMIVIGRHRVVAT
jgi:hypothetical protein